MSKLAGIQFTSDNADPIAKPLTSTSADHSDAAASRTIDSSVFANARPAIPHVLREVEFTSVTPMSQASILSLMSRDYKWRAQDQLASNVAKIPFGEIDIFYLKPVMEILFDGSNSADATTRLMDLARRYSSFAAVMRVFSSKDLTRASGDHLVQLTGAGLGKDKNGAKSGKVDDIDSSLSAALSAMDDNHYAALGMGAVQARTVSSTGDAELAPLLELPTFLRTYFDPIHSKTGIDGILATHAFRIYTEAVRHYGSPLFDSLTSYDARVLERERAERLQTYAVMIAETAILPTVVKLVLLKQRASQLYDILKSQKTWQETDIHKKAFEDAMTAYKNATNTNASRCIQEIQGYMDALQLANDGTPIIPGDLKTVPGEFEPHVCDCQAFANLTYPAVTEIGTGLASLLKPSAGTTIMTSGLISQWAKDFMAATQALSATAHNVTITMTLMFEFADTVALSPEWRPYSFSIPNFHKPRYLSVSDQTPHNVGIPRYDATGTDLVLAPHINKIVNFRHVRDAVLMNTKAFPRLVRSPITAFDGISEMLKLPIPKHLMIGELHEDRSLSSLSLIVMAREMGLPEYENYANIVETALLGLPAVPSAHVVGALAGTFLVISKTDTKTQIPSGRKHLDCEPWQLPTSWTKDRTLYLLSPGSASQSLTTYGISSAHVIQAHLDILKGDVKKEELPSGLKVPTVDDILWASDDGDVGLLPVFVLPPLAVTQTKYVQISSHNMVQQHMNQEGRALINGNMSLTDVIGRWVANPVFTASHTFCPSIRTEVVPAELPKGWDNCVGMTSTRVYTYVKDTLFTPGMGILKADATPWVADVADDEPEAAVPTAVKDDPNDSDIKAIPKAESGPKIVPMDDLPAADLTSAAIIPVETTIRKPTEQLGDEKVDSGPSHSPIVHMRFLPPMDAE